MKSKRAHFRRFADVVLIVSVALGSFYATAYAALAPRDADSGVAVIFPPWTSEHDAFMQSVEAGARFVRFGGYGFIAVVIPEAPGYAGRARHLGALAVVDPQALAACLGEPALGQLQ